MPQLGETVTEGTITRWLKSVGEEVIRDEPLFEISTDKVDSEVPSPASGILTQILVQEGDTVFVGTQLAVISVDGVVPLSSQDASSAPLQSSSPLPPQIETPDHIALQVNTPIIPRSDSPVPPQIDRPAVGVNDSISQTSSSLDASLSSNNDPESGSATLNGTLTSPLVRRMIAEQGIDPSKVIPTGTGGRITREDVLASKAQVRQKGHLPEGLPGQAGQDSRLQAWQAEPPSPEKQQGLPEYTQPQTLRTQQLQTEPLSLRSQETVTPLAGSDEIIPFDNIRRRTAEHMVMSKATSPHTLISMEADYEAVEQVRHLYGERFRAEEGYTLSYLPFAARAAVEALKQWPRLNASVVDDSLVVHHKINLGIAVDINHEGLIVPVVHRADDLTLRGMARRIHDLATRARTRQLAADDISGGTFSITNAGHYGTLMTVAIINQPQVAILSTDGVKRKPVVVTDSFGAESIAIHSVGVLAMSFDHRAVDGAYVAAFLSTMASILATHDFITEI